MERDIENKMGKFIRDFRVITEQSGVVDYEMLRNGLRKLLEQELSKAKEEGYKDTLKEIKKIMESHIENDTSTYEIIELLLNEYDGSGMKVSN